MTSRIGFALDGATLSSGLEEYIQQGTNAGGIRHAFKQMTLGAGSVIDAGLEWANAAIAGGVITLTGTGSWVKLATGASGTGGGYVSAVVSAQRRFRFAFTAPAGFMASDYGFCIASSTHFVTSSNIYGACGGLLIGTTGKIGVKPFPGSSWYNEKSTCPNGDFVFEGQRGDDGIWRITLTDPDGYVICASLSTGMVGDLYPVVYHYGGTYSLAVTSIYQDYSSTAETVELVASTQAGTYARSSLDLVAAANGTRLATSDAGIQVADNVDGAGWSSWYTVDAFHALADAVVTSTYQLKVQITGDGGQLVELTGVALNVTVTAAGTAPGQASFTLTYDPDNSDRFAYTTTAGSGTVTATYLHYRLVGSTNAWTTISSTGSGTVSSLAEGVYQVSACSANGTVCGAWAPCQLVSVGTDRIKQALAEIKARIQAASITGLQDRAVQVTATREYLAAGTPAVQLVYTGEADLYETNLVEVRANIECRVFYDAAHDSTHGSLIDGDNVHDLGVVKIAGLVRAALKGWKPSTCAAVVAPSALSAPSPVKGHSVYMCAFSAKLRLPE